LPATHLEQARPVPNAAPPQSMSVSLPFLLPSVHVGAGMPDEDAELELPEVLDEDAELELLDVLPDVVLLEPLELELVLLAEPLELAELALPEVLDVPPVLEDALLPLEELPTSVPAPGSSMPQAAATRVAPTKPPTKSKERERMYS
jgi:hypothetical protein